MRKFTVASIWGIPIRISVSLVVFLPLLAWLIGSGQQIPLYADLIQQLSGVDLDRAVLRAGLTPWVIGVLAAVGLFVSVTIHELGHSWVARRYGLEIESITLWILGGIAAFTSLPREWNREFWIAIAGPTTSILVGGVCWAALLVLPGTLTVVQFVLGWLAIVNVILALFNLLPAFPMDGGRVLRALLARRRPYASATRIAARIGVVFALVFAILGVIGFNVILLLLAVFIYGAATTESKTVLMDELLEGITVGDIMTTDPHTVSTDTTVAEFGDRMLRERQTVYPVTDRIGEIVGIVTLNDLKQTKREERETKTVGTLLRDVPRVDASADAFDTLVHLGQAKSPTALVVDGDSVVGVVSEADYARAFTIQRGFEATPM
ncbi:site-2 protease family protein [Haloarchaeobius sp. HRN-SO-5]|uniref:site-2 protease family protein n=1 Tax=Haloarchaeobius sp. HRN-SO-5 TaxID=3446118 RepID=UPI003EB9DB23